MKKLLVFLSVLSFMFISCEKEEILEPVLEIALDGESFDPNERYAQIKSFGGVKYDGDTIKKIFILYLQVDDGEPRLDRQHFALYVLDSDGDDNGALLDIGTYTWENPDNKYAGVEIPATKNMLFGIMF